MCLQFRVDHIAFVKSVCVVACENFCIWFEFQRGAIYPILGRVAIVGAERRRTLYDADRRQVHGHGNRRYRQGRVGSV